MLLSEFTPLELFELSDEEPLAERIYNTMVAAHGGQFDMTVGESRQEAWCFATALSKARMLKTIERAGAQSFVGEVDDLIARRESEYGIVPAFDATFLERRAALLKRRRRPPTWTKARITAALQEILGDDFIAYRPTPVAEVVRWPAALGDQPQNLQRPTVERKVARLTQPISLNLGVLQSVTYELVDASTDLITGDTIVVEPDVLGISETVTDIRVGSGPAKVLQGVFNNPHTVGCLCSTAAYPKWISTKRHSLVVVTPGAAVDPEKRRRVDEEMRRMVRASSTWDIVQSFDGLTTGELLLDEPGIGVQTFVDITL